MWHGCYLNLPLPSPASGAQRQTHHFVDADGARVGQISARHQPANSVLSGMREPSLVGAPLGPSSFDLANCDTPSDYVSESARALFVPSLLKRHVTAIVPVGPNGGNIWNLKVDVVDTGNLCQMPTEEAGQMILVYTECC